MLWFSVNMLKQVHCRKRLNCVGLSESGEKVHFKFCIDLSLPSSAALCVDCCVIKVFFL